jgi:NADH-quinone oxidoreductase subunit J
MSLYALIFYTLGAVIVGATGLAITRRQVMHAVVYLVISFLATALLFYLLGAPLLAALEIIIYAGAIMVLFLFIVMMMEMGKSPERPGAYLRQWLPALLLGGVCLAVTLALLLGDSGAGAPLKSASASPLAFGRFLFERYWLSVEIASLLLLVALVGAWYLGRRDENTEGP